MRRLTARLEAAETAHARALDVEARKAKARVDAAKEETAAAFAREKELWAEVHKLRERTAATAVTVPSEPAERELLRLETVLQERLLGGWNQVACSMRGLGAPPALTPGFADRAEAWAPEAQAAARARPARSESIDGGHERARDCLEEERRLPDFS